MYHKTRHRVHTLLHPELGDTNWDRAFNAFIIVLIILNVAAVIFETVPSIYDANKAFFHTFDVISVTIFTIEYILRVWSAPHEKRYRHPVYGRIKYILSPSGLIDLIAILPFYLHVLIGFDLRALRMLRLFRFLRLFKLTAYMKAAKLIAGVFKSTFSQLMLSFVMVFILIIISSSLVYFAEHVAQPKVFTSIPHTLWWSVVTITTVGYGDMVPVTVLGKVFTSLILLAGVALFALPAGILTAGFLEQSRKHRTKNLKSVCPHCHMPLEAEQTEHVH